MGEKSAEPEGRRDTVHCTGHTVWDGHGRTEDRVAIARGGHGCEPLNLTGDLNINTQDAQGTARQSQ